MPRAMRWSTLIVSCLLLTAAAHSASAQRHVQYYPLRSTGQDWAMGQQQVRQLDHPTPQNCLPRQYTNPDLFYNYYAPATCGGVPAQMYVAPHETPAHVGHTYYTYQPFLPHEHLYQHHRTYRHYYNHNMGMHRTAAVYWSSPVKQALWKGWVQLGFPQD